MNERSAEINFLAVLIFDEGNGCLCEEPRVYSAAHPEIAYQIALAHGNEQRYGRRFLGLSHLEETTEEVLPITRSQKGDAGELVCNKEDLLAFSDPRWKNVLCDEAELVEALREPPLLFEICGLQEIPWYQYTDAYGSASDVPRDIRRLTSSEPEIREQALWELFGSIYHQGTIYSATAAAVPFLLRLVSDRRLPDRTNVCELLAEIAKSSAIDPEKVRKKWARIRQIGGEIYAKPTDEMAADEVANRANVHQAFCDHFDALQSLRSDSDPKVAKVAASILQHLDGKNGNGRN